MRAHRYVRHFTLFAALFVAGCSEGDDVYLCEDIACEDTNRVCVDDGESGASCGDCVSGFSEVEGACTVWTTCDESAGELESVPPTATSDRVCSPCGAGMYALDGECAELTACEEGAEFEAVAATATSDRVCSVLSACELGVTYETYAPMLTSDRVCDAVRACTAAEIKVSAPTLTSDRVCLSCSWDTEFWSANASGVAECVPRLSACPAGFGHSADEAPFPRNEDYSCQDECPNGTFNDGSQIFCMAHSTCDLQTEYVSISANAARDRQCDAFDVVGGQAFEVNRVHAGTFWMGRAPDDPDAPIPGPLQAQVTLTRDFVLGRYEVTLGQYDAVMGTQFSDIAGFSSSHPIVGRILHERIAYIGRLNSILGLPQCYNDDGNALDGTTVYNCEGYRLPVDAEWEYAARAETTTPRYGVLEDIAWRPSERS